MKSRHCPLFASAVATAVLVASLSYPAPVLAQSSATIITLSGTDLAYSDVTQMIYVSNTNSSTITPINAITGAVGSPITISNLSGRLCAGDGGSYIFAALN